MEIKVEQRERQFEPIDFHIKIESLEEIEIIRGLLGSMNVSDIKKHMELSMYKSHYTNICKISPSTIGNLQNKLYNAIRKVHDKLK